MLKVGHVIPSRPLWPNFYFISYEILVINLYANLKFLARTVPEIWRASQNSKRPANRGSPVTPYLDSPTPICSRSLLTKLPYFACNLYRPKISMCVLSVGNGSYDSTRIDSFVGVGLLDEAHGGLIRSLSVVAQGDTKRILPTWKLRYLIYYEVVHRVHIYIEN